MWFLMSSRSVLGRETEAHKWQLAAKRESHAHTHILWAMSRVSSSYLLCCFVLISPFVFFPVADVFYIPLFFLISLLLSNPSCVLFVNEDTHSHCQAQTHSSIPNHESLSSLRAFLVSFLYLPSLPPTMPPHCCYNVPLHALIPPCTSLCLVFPSLHPSLLHPSTCLSLSRCLWYSSPLRRLAWQTAVGFLTRVTAEKSPFRPPSVRHGHV